MITDPRDSLSTETLLMIEEELEGDLLLNTPKYRDLMAIRKMLADRNLAPAAAVRSPPVVSRTKPGTAETPYRPVTVRLGRVTAISAAVMALNEAGRPMNIHELVEEVQKRGFEFGGSSKSPPSALSAYFAKPGPKSPIVSIWVDNKPMWWFRDQPVPGAEVA